jgi:hypothetical protein
MEDHTLHQPEPLMEVVKDGVVFKVLKDQHLWSVAMVLIVLRACRMHTHDKDSQ